jgi:hypothetical protein
MPNLFDKATRTRMAGLYGTPAQRTAAWHDQQLRNAKECIAQADKRHTPEEIAAAQAALAVDPQAPQSELKLQGVK